jgi:hypothetical protein
VSSGIYGKVGWWRLTMLYWVFQNKDSEYSYYKEMIKVWGEEYVNCPGLIMTQWMQVLKYQTVPHIYV